jgi:hypothetical protein
VLKVDQAWGVFQASVAAHNNHVGYYSGYTGALGEFAGHPDDKWGWAGQLALSVLLPMIAKGDVINVQGVYTNGASRYNIQDLAGPAVWANYGNSGLAGAMRERLLLNPGRVMAIANGMRDVASLPDPVGETLAVASRCRGHSSRRARRWLRSGLAQMVAIREFAGRGFRAHVSAREKHPQRAARLPGPRYRKFRDVQEQPRHCSCRP